ncbi:hypothetical protein [Belnapia arida]|nr:hypothetical protein [Belnapia arida]
MSPLAAARRGLACTGIAALLGGLSGQVHGLAAAILAACSGLPPTRLPR